MQPPSAPCIARRPGAAGTGHWIVSMSRKVTGAQSRWSEESSRLEKRPHPVHRDSWETAQSPAQNTERKVVTRLCPGPCTLLLASGHLPLDGQLSRLSSHPLPTGLTPSDPACSRTCLLWLLCIPLCLPGFSRSFRGQPEIPSFQNYFCLWNYPLRHFIKKQ